jgi:hypothetical protein
MNTTPWDRYADSTFELWDHFIWLLAQRLCQSRGIGSQGKSDHIRNPAKCNDPCEQCYFELADLVDPDLCDAIGILGSAAYRLGHEGIAEDEASVRALREIVDDLVRREESKKLLAEAGGEKAWWNLSPERDRLDWLGPPDDNPQRRP